ncbi:phosphodiester glycosidase family protein [Luteolibacter luteus]|uniref:Phosphodiester glycosidase family protein n=1 Tax=Luteolibacter luteus TaxID=2728835 RepID=A0A858RFL3_9BACT|nr:phosphodiester glycosidase family protein [Luteolibacter luteus]QJE95354.1 phosphodiester glycosidase family protein [Luteolibacter luteus]
MRFRPFIALVLLNLPALRAEEPVQFAPLPDSVAPFWQPLYQGVDYRLDELSVPRRLRIHQIRVDTRAEGVAFFTTPDNGDAPEEVNGRRTATFLKEFDLEVAINGSAFKPIAKEGIPVDLQGLSISNGVTVSEVDAKSANPVFLATATQQPRILRGPFRKRSFGAAHNALQGWYGSNGMLLDNGEVTTTTLDIHPRTALGVSREGLYVYLLVVDGRQQGFSEGMTLVELAEWMKQLGCWDAMNLDGGGSSTMVIKGGDGAPKILNSPSGGSQRSVGNHLGIHALPFP